MDENHFAAYVDGAQRSFTAVPYTAGCKGCYFQDLATRMYPHSGVCARSECGEGGTGIFCGSYARSDSRTIIWIEDNSSPETEPNPL